MRFRCPCCEIMCIKSRQMCVTLVRLLVIIGGVLWCIFDVRSFVETCVEDWQGLVTFSW